MRRTRMLIVSIVLLALLALPATALATKRLYGAKMRTTYETHPVVGSSAIGAFQMATLPDGSALQFRLRVDGLSGAPTGAHLHAPAGPTEDAPIIITLCGAGPSPIVAACSYDPGTNSMLVEGQITGSTLAARGISGPDFQNWLDGGLIYVNVHTALNPAGEVRGQVVQVFP